MFLPFLWAETMVLPRREASKSEGETPSMTFGSSAITAFTIFLPTQCSSTALLAASTSGSSGMAVCSLLSFSFFFSFFLARFGASLQEQLVRHVARLEARKVGRNLGFSLWLGLGLSQVWPNLQGLGPNIIKIPQKRLGLNNCKERKFEVCEVVTNFKLKILNMLLV